jgi:uncharacterized cupin superfamily protein
MRRFNVFEAAVAFAENPDELPPGQSVCPFHCESEEEWLLVLEGRLTPSHDPAGNVRVRRGQRLDYFDGEL